MKKILCFIMVCGVCIFNADAASRSENAVARGKSVPTTTNGKSVRTPSVRNAVKTTVVSRDVKNVSVLTPRATQKTTATRTPVSRTTNTTVKNVTARVADNAKTVVETRTGAAYEQCKEAFFTCMDQFCQLKNDSFKRCSCSNRIFDFQEISETYQQATNKLNQFTEDLDVVGMSYEQAAAMKTATEGEDALAEDKSASKQLLQAIMNSISGGDTTVGGKYKDLNSLKISDDMSYAFGMDDSGQLIASYDGATLYRAVYPKCRNAVREDCNNASLQRAVNAYLMAIEQDCNTVESALANQQKTLKAATHEGSAMLDLARVENRRAHNSDDVATCVANVESAIKSEEVCGSGYHKCLDNGQFIDVTTGAPLTGVVDFYKLGEILTFRDNADIKDQKLSAIQNNRSFVQFFENKTKKFAKDALDKCSEDADFVWQQYLDMALVDIYYAQQSKVKDIRQSCFTLVAKCYDDQSTSVANAMANLTGDSSVLLKPAAIELTTQMCSKYIESCDNMFFAHDDKNIIQDYIANKDVHDSLNACRGIAQQCFSEYGGTRYGNFYSGRNGLFARGTALDWFSLYDENNKVVSPCAKQVAETPECANKLEEVFGGFNKYVNNNNIVYSAQGQDDTNRKIRESGVATEVYYQILDNLANHCNSLGGYFVEYRYAAQYGYKTSDFCKIDSGNVNSVFYIDTSANPANSLVYWYHFNQEENMCPSGYDTEVDTQSWGMCSCWENGGYRSKNGSSPTCRPVLPAISGNSASEDASCSTETLCKASYGADTIPELCQQPRDNTSQYWCQQSVASSSGQLCPTTTTKDGYCAEGNNKITVVAEKVPTRGR